MKVKNNIMNVSIIPGNGFIGKLSGRVREIHSSWIRFAIDLGMEVLSPSCMLYEQGADLYASERESIFERTSA